MSRSKDPVLWHVLHRKGRTSLRTGGTVYCPQGSAQTQPRGCLSSCRSSNSLLGRRRPMPAVCVLGDPEHDRGAGEVGREEANEGMVSKKSYCWPLELVLLELWEMGRHCLGVIHSRVRRRGYLSTNTQLPLTEGDSQGQASPYGQAPLGCFPGRQRA